MSLDPNSIVASWLSTFGDALQQKNPQAASESFTQDCWLRESQIFSWDNRTLHGRDKVHHHLSQAFLRRSFSNFRVDTRKFLAPERGPVGPHHQGILSGFLFETDIQWGQGYVQLIQEGDGVWRAFVVYMIAADLKGHEETGREVGMYGEQLGVYGDHSTPWPSVVAARRKNNEENPRVLIIGAGQTGVQIAARFKQMNIPTLVIDAQPRLGDSWRNRYNSLTLHSTRMHDHFLYQRFPDNWPLHTPKDKLASWVEQYADAQDLTIWTSSKPAEDSTPVYDESTKRWTITIDRAGQRVTLHPAHIICCLGILGKPVIPKVKNLETFKGTVVHGAEYNSPLPFTNKNVVVVGAGNTAGDICIDLSTCAASITLVQRSESALVPAETVANGMMHPWPDDGSVPTDIADFKASAVPLKLMRIISRVRKAGGGGEEGKYAEMYRGLREKGMIVNDGEEHEGVLFQVLQRGGGYIIDVGLSKLVITGRVKVKHGVEVAELKENSVVFSDGSEIPADVVIFATGYDSIQHDFERIFGKDTIDRAGPIWGMDEEGELRNVFRPTGHPALWFGGGSSQHARYGSKQLALQIKAAELGLRDD